MLRTFLRRLCSSSGHESHMEIAARTHSWAMSTNLATYSPNFDWGKAAPTSVPIFQTATFDCRKNQGQYDYTRSGNPTRDALEELCRKAEGEMALRAFAFSSGMAALTSVTRLLEPGDSILASKDIYGGMHRLLRYAEKHSKLQVEFIETWDLTKTISAAEQLKDKLKLICVETRTNPQLRVSDIRKLANIAHEKGALLCVDNSIMSPVLLRPLELGADLVVHSATKFFSGHSDVMAGIVAVRSQNIADRIAFIQNTEGNGLSPFDSWLVLRGMRTMALRVREAQQNAEKVAKYLRSSPYVGRVYSLHPSLTSNESNVFRVESKLHFSQAQGGGSVIGFDTGCPKFSHKIIQNTTLFKNTVSFGSYTSLIEIPSQMSHASIPENEQTISSSLIRLSIGIEDSSDLIYDLDVAIARAAADSSNFKMQYKNSRSQDLGVSLPPNDPHAVGVSMPKWEHVIAYEEGCKAVHNKLTAGYPRFVFLKPVRELFQKVEDMFAEAGESAMVLPSARVALRLQQFLKDHRAHGDVRIVDLYAHGSFAVLFNSEDFGIAKKFWQHTGEIISSRFAEIVLQTIERTCYENSKENDSKTKQLQPFIVENDEKSIEELRERVAALCGQVRSSVFLYPTGMAALSSAHRLLQLSSEWEVAPLRTIVFGFPYLDTLKLSEITTKCVFFGKGDESDIADLEKLLETESFGGVFCEFPSNPLLISPNLVKLREICSSHNLPIICDSTVAFPNVNILGKNGADIMILSLTKQFSGSGNVMGGALILNTDSEHCAKLQSRLFQDHEELLWGTDARVLLDGSKDFVYRTIKANKTAQTLVNLLHKHPFVEKVYHPSIMTPFKYEEWQANVPYAGKGALFSVLFKNELDSRNFYNNLDVAKGPGFGTNFTLACPYTIIAHFYELEWAKKYGVDAKLIRIWVGQEEVEDIVDRFQKALSSLNGS